MSESEIEVFEYDMSEHVEWGENRGGFKEAKRRYGKEQKEKGN